MKFHALNRPHLKDLRERGCASKVAYDTEDAAGTDLKAVRKAGKVPGFSKLRVYKCHFCPKWHIGHP